MTPEQIRWLTWGAMEHRPTGAPKWDEPGTSKAINDHCRAWDFVTAVEHVLAHARDPKARTPFAIKGNPPHTETTRGPRFPAKGADECRSHPGEYAASCRLCAVNDITRPDDPVIDDPSCTAGLALLADIRARKAATTPTEQGEPA